MAEIDYDAELNGPIRAIQKERCALALKLRRDGLTYVAIGQKLGVKGSRAADLAKRGLRLEKYSKPTSTS